MRILFVYQFCTLGGVETIVSARMRELLAMGVDARVLFLEGGDGERLFQEFGDRLLIAAGRKQIEAQLESFEPDYVLSIDTPQIMPYLPAAPDARLVYEVHTTYREGLAYLDGEIHTGRVAGLIVPSHAQGRSIRSLFPHIAAMPLHVVHNLLPHHFFEAHNAAAYGRPIVAWVGRLDPHKDWRAFVRIADELHRARSEVEFWIVGGGRAAEDQKAGLLAAASERGLMGRLRWLPAVDYARMPALYHFIAGSGGCVVSTSREESFGMVALEAMACGCPAIVPEVGGLVEVVEDGVGGLRYPPGDISAAMERITRILDDSELRVRAAAAGRRRAREEFSPRATAQRLIEVLRSLAPDVEVGKAASIPERDIASAAP